MRDEFDIGKPSVQDYPCDHCKRIIKNAIVPRCCNGNGYGLGGCGCMGLPTEPVTCSAKCERKIWSKYHQGRNMECPDCFRGSNQYPIQECCGNALPNGECCGNAVQKMEHVPCQTCNATGRIKRPSWKKRKPSYNKVYRGILIEVRSGYANARLKSMQVCVHTPDIERYFKSTAGVRRFIDKFLSEYQPIDNGLPF